MSSDSANMSTASTAKSWCDYFDTRPYRESMFFDRESSIARLQQLSSSLFTSVTDLEIIESANGTDKLSNVRIQSEDSLSKRLETVPIPALRILSIAQTFSLSPFTITESSMCRILMNHNISPGFLNILIGFGDRKASPDEGSPSGLYSSFNATSHFIFYQFGYPELNNRKHGDPWSVRQTGVYHRFSTHPAKQLENIWLLLHPMQKSKAQTRLAEVTKDLTADNIAFDPLKLHVLIMSSYIDNWRWYLHDIKRRYTKLEDTLMTDVFKDDRGLNFDTLQDLRHFKSKVLPVPAMLESLISTLRSIIDMNQKLPQSATGSPATETSHHLACCSSRLQAYLSTADILLKRIENMTKFLADALNAKNQEIAVQHQAIAGENQKIATDSNMQLVKLTNDTVDDSSTVKTITFITLVYLPASFISGLFGMNLFKFDDSWTFDMSPQIWIYVAAVAILMIITFGFWLVFRLHQEKQKKRKEEDAKLNPA